MDEYVFVVLAFYEKRNGIAWGEFVQKCPVPDQTFFCKLMELGKIILE